MGRLWTIGEISIYFSPMEKTKSTHPEKRFLSLATEVWRSSKPAPSRLTKNYKSREPALEPGPSPRPAPETRFPRNPRAWGAAGISRAPPRGAPQRGFTSRRPSRQIPCLREVRDGGVWFRRRVRGKHPGGGARRPRPLRRGPPRVPATGRTAARLSCPRCQVPTREGWGGALLGWFFAGVGPTEGGTRFQPAFRSDKKKFGKLEPGLNGGRLQVEGSWSWLLSVLGKHVGKQVS